MFLIPPVQTAQASSYEAESLYNVDTAPAGLGIAPTSDAGVDDDQQMTLPT